MDERPVKQSRQNETWGVRSTLRFVLVTLGPAFAAFALELVVLKTVTRWLVFTVAMFFSSWFGGFKSGIVATAVSAVLVWWFLTPPEKHFSASDPRSYVSVVTFVLIGITISVFHERLRRATRDLKDYHQLVDVVMEHSPGLIAVKDLEGKILLANRRLGEALGVSRNALEGKTVSEVSPPVAATSRRDVDAHIIQTETSATVEESVELKDGTHVFLATGFPLRDRQRGIFGVCWIETDITERKRAESALVQTAADLNQAQRTAHIGSWSWNPESDVMRWSDELYRIHRRDPSAPPPNFLTEYPNLFAGESAQRLRDAIEKLRKDGTPFSLELETNQPDRATRWISASGEAVYDASNQLVEVRGVSQDVSKLKELQRAKDEWTSVIAHDLRQPIGVIKMSAQLLPEIHSGKMGEEEETITGRIRSASDSLARMVDDLLDVTRLETKRLALTQIWADPKTLVNESVQRASHLTSGRTMKLSHTGEPVQVFVDPARFDQVLGNLLSNATKYGEQNSVIIVHVDHRKNEIEVSVTNRGRGIAPEDAAHLFTRFGRSKATRGSGIPGLGLGLYIAKGIVEAHGGRMWVESVPDETTTFHFTLPSREVGPPAVRLAS